MELSQEERRIVERLRKQEQSWRWGRWMMLFVGLFSLGLSVTGLVIVIPFLQRASDTKAESAVAAAFMLALLHPAILGFACVGIVALFWTIRDWRGNSTRILLLRLLDDRTKTER